MNGAATRGKIESGMRFSLVVFFVLPCSLAAQEPELRQLPKNWAKDQKFIWTRPFHLTHKQAKTLVPFALVTAALIATDRHTSAGLPNTPDQIHISSAVSNAGIGAMAAAGAGLFAFGRLGGDESAGETGLLSAEAAADSFAVVEVLKVATNRQRPQQDQGHGRFWAGGKSFPSGHAILAWSIAEVLASEYHEKPLVRVAAYALAAAVSLSRFPARQHFPSDILVGSATGFLIGKHVYASHHGGRAAWLTPAPSFHIDPGGRAYGLTLSWTSP